MFGEMRHLLLLVFILTASASPPVADENSDHVVKEEVFPEATLERTETEEDAPAAGSGVVEPDSVVLEPETTEEHRAADETPVVVEEPVLEADYLLEDTPETELESEPEIPVIQAARDQLPVEEYEELEFVQDMDVVMGTGESVLEEPTLEGDYIVAEEPEEVMEPGRERRVPLHNGRWSCKGIVLQNKCYTFFRGSVPAYTAEFQCQDACLNGHLASVTNHFIRDAVGRLMDMSGGRTNAWIGGYRMLGTNNFIWFDGTHWNYNAWHSGEPNNLGGNENCVEIWSNLAFNDESCSTSRPFICSCPN